VLEVEANGARPGFAALLSPSEGLLQFISRHAAAARQGRIRLPLGGRRRHPRFDSCLEVDFGGYPELSGEYAANISKGGLFIRTINPPPLRAQVRLRVKLPDGDVAETEAEVVHVVSAEEARQRGTVPGGGVAFAEGNTPFHARIEAFLAAFPTRKPRVLVVDDDLFFRRVLGDALSQAGIDVDTAGDGEEALRKLVQRLFELDLVILDLQMPGLDGYCLIDRVRRLGGEMDLRIVVLSGAEERELERVKGREGANDVIRKGTSIEEIVRRIQSVLA